MTRLKWGETERFDYEFGVDRGVLYPLSGSAQPWNGLVSVQESPSNADERVRYIDGRKTRTKRRPGEFSGTIEAFTYPESFYEDVFTGRRPKKFDLSYRVRTESSYKIHLVYNVLIVPSGSNYEQDELGPFSWEFTTKPVHIPDHRPSAHLVVDASMAYPATIADFEARLYGDDEVDSSLPQPEEVLEIFDVNSILKITNHPDGSWTAEGPDDVVYWTDATSFVIDWPSVVWIDSETYTVQSH